MSYDAIPSTLSRMACSTAMRRPPEADPHVRRVPDPTTWPLATCMTGAFICGKWLLVEVA